MQCEPKDAVCKFKVNLCELKGIECQYLLYQKL